MNNLIFDYVGDVNYKYPYIYIYHMEDQQPFMEIGITDEKELVFTIFSRNHEVKIPLGEWEKILHAAEEFLPKALANEAAFEIDHT